MSDPRQGKSSASGVEGIWLCPGKANAEAGLPELPSPAEDVKDSGIAIHAALAGDILALKGLSSDDMAVYEEMSRKADELAVKHGFDPELFHAEQRLWYGTEFSGQADRLYKQSVRALLIDFKAGFIPTTDSASNPQLAALAVLAIRNYNVARVTVAIIPRFGAVKEVAEYDLDSAQAALTMIRNIIAKSQEPDAPRIPGPRQCLYCRFKRQCPEYAEYVHAVATIPKVSLPTLPADKLASAIERITAVLDLVEALKAEGKRRLRENDPEFSKFYRLTEGRKLSEITDIVTVFKRMEALGIKDGEFTAQCTIQKGAVDKNNNGVGLKYLIRKATGLRGEALNEKLKEVLSGCTTETRSDGSLKRKDLK